MIKKIITGDFDTNTYLITKDKKCIIIDPGLDFLSTATKIKSEYEVEAILITHGHMDHIDGIQFFDVPVYFPKGDEEFLYDETLSLYRMFGQKSPFLHSKLDLILVEDGFEFQLLGTSFHVLHTPGHTRGSVCYLTNGVLFSGDTLFHLSVGRTDFPTGNSKSLLASLKKIIKYCKDTVVIYPGHSEETTIHEERLNNPWMK